MDLPLDNVFAAPQFFPVLHRSITTTHAAGAGPAAFPAWTCCPHGEGLVGGPVLHLCVEGLCPEELCVASPRCSHNSVCVTKDMGLKSQVCV